MSDGYSSGYEAVAAAIENAKQRTSGPRSSYITWSDKEKKLVRLLSDQVITIGFHSFTVCVDGKKRDFVCAAQLAGDKQRPCLICDTHTWRDKEGNTRKVQPWGQTVGLAVVRKEEIKDGQAFVRDLYHKDALELEVDGKMQKFENVPFIGVIKQSHGNFWSNLNAYYARYGTTVDRDYEITRSGGDTGTKYTIIPLDVDENLRVALPTGKTDVEATRKLVLETYAPAMQFHPTLVEWIERMGSVERYNAHLLGKGTDTNSAEELENQIGGEEPTGPTEDASDGGEATSSFSSLRDQLQAYKKA